MKVLHLTCVRELSSGQRKQLTYEYNVKDELNIEWDVVILHSKKVQDKRFEIQIPKFFRGLFLRNFYAWIYLLRVQKKYDVIVNRHMTFDPFILIFGWIIKNRITVHHSKEVEELKLIRKDWKGKFASIFESFSGKISLIQTKSVISVTHDIAEYQKTIYPVNTFIYPNAIDINTVSLLKDNRINSEINIVFVCGTFSSWHGLDLLLDSVLLNIKLLALNKVKIHLVGKLLQKEQEFLSVHKELDQFIFSHGLLYGDNYTNILSMSDLGLSSFALNRKGLTEAATLKVREYLAYGLPVYSGHNDTAIMGDYEFYKVGSCDIKEIINFSKIIKNEKREYVRSSSEIYISKKNILNQLYHDIKNS